MAMQLFGVNIKNPISYAKAVIIWITFIAISFALMSFNNGGVNKAVANKNKIDSTTTTEKTAFPELLAEEAAAETVITTVSLLETYPEAASFIEKYAAKEGKAYQRMKPKAQRYFDLYDKILDSYGLPLELKYLSLVESNLNNKAVSKAGAAGPWQFMPADGKRFGLKINGSVDERKDYTKSTHAAAKYLKELYARYGDWLLVVASYNCGPNRVKRAIDKVGSNNYWDIQHLLPAETRSHVKKYISMQYIFEGDEIEVTAQNEDFLLAKS